MSLTIEEIQKIAHLARLNLSPDDLDIYSTQLHSVLDFIAQIESIDTTKVEPLGHPMHEISQRLREDAVTEINAREKFQQLAPQEKAGLYLVPQVIEEA